MLFAQVLAKNSRIRPQNANCSKSQIQSIQKTTCEKTKSDTEILFQKSKIFTAKTPNNGETHACQLTWNRLNACSYADIVKGKSTKNVRINQICARNDTICQVKLPSVKTNPQISVKQNHIQTSVHKGRTQVKCDATMKAKVNHYNTHSGFVNLCSKNCFTSLETLESESQECQILNTNIHQNASVDTHFKKCLTPPVTVHSKNNADPKINNKLHQHQPHVLPSGDTENVALNRSHNDTNNDNSVSRVPDTQGGNKSRNNSSSVLG